MAARAAGPFFFRTIDMALYTELPVYRDTYQLTLKVFEYTREFARDYKFTLGEDMRRDVLKLTGSIYRANKSTSKEAHLDSFLDEFELLKLKIRLCVDMKLLPMRKQALLSGLLESISKQVIGWRNANR